jgi:hypothetical protein
VAISALKAQEARAGSQGDGHSSFLGLSKDDSFIYSPENEL